MFKIDIMSSKHLDEVYAIEQESFSVPWTKEDIKKDVNHNPVAKYMVAIDESNFVVGYVGLWIIGDEGHITNLAVKEANRQQGVGSFLLEELFKLSKFYELNALTLEVRFGNLKAQKLYFKYGFVTAGIRKNYYADTKEDALIMWKYFND